jgi:hypothetical protein
LLHIIITHIDATTKGKGLSAKISRTQWTIYTIYHALLLITHAAVGHIVSQRSNLVSTHVHDIPC